MKEGIHYSYKRGNDRNTRAQDSLSIYKQALFSWSLFQDMINDNLIVNADESSFGWSVKFNYSWLPKNRSSGIVNINAQSRTSMICGLLSNGNWMWLLIDDRVTTMNFGMFLFLLSTYTNSNLPAIGERVTLILDNALIHLTNSTKNTAIQYGIKILGLPTYWHHLTP